jgi:hypothetical protein
LAASFANGIYVLRNAGGEANAFFSRFFFKMNLCIISGEQRG